MPNKFLIFTLLLCVFIITTGCANHSARSEQLLETEYHTLSDDDLILYYYDLNDHIELVERRQAKPRLSLGFGLGSFGSRSGVSTGVGVSTSGTSSTGATSDLRSQRNRVKLELQKRGLKF